MFQRRKISQTNIHEILSLNPVLRAEKEVSEMVYFQDFQKKRAKEKSPKRAIVQKNIPQYWDHNNPDIYINSHQKIVVMTVFMIKKRWKNDGADEDISES